MIINKNEVLKITNEYFISFYCKDEICILVNVNYDAFIELPNKNGDIQKYITGTCRIDNINVYDCPINCFKDIECLSNKCYNYNCVFNNETSIDHCDNIYSKSIIFGESSYMYCGKPYNDICKKDNECSSKKCLNGICTKQVKGPSDESDSDSFINFIKALIFLIIIIFFISLLIACCCIKLKKV